MDRIYGKSVNSTWMNVKLTYPSDNNNNMVAADDTDSDNGNNIIEVPDVEEIFMEEEDN